MKKTIVLYTSKYGSTLKYAQWLADEFSCDMLEAKKADVRSLLKYDTIIFGGGVYAGGISGLSFIKKYYDQLKDKQIIVFAVGLTPYDDRVITELKENNFKDLPSQFPCFYCRGSLNQERLSFMDRMLCNFIKKAVSNRDAETFDSREKALIEAMKFGCDWTDKNELKDLIAYVSST